MYYLVSDLHQTISYILVNKLEYNDLKKVYEVLKSVSSGRGDVSQDELYQILTQVNVCQCFPTEIVLYGWLSHS
jgi:hypothetical protein